MFNTANVNFYYLFVVVLHDNFTSPDVHCFYEVIFGSRSCQGLSEKPVTVSILTTLMVPGEKFVSCTPTELSLAD
jgi:hypothetical protein